MKECIVFLKTFLHKNCLRNLLQNYDFRMHKTTTDYTDCFAQLIAS